MPQCGSEVVVAEVRAGLGGTSGRDAVENAGWSHSAAARAGERGRPWAECSGGAEPPSSRVRERCQGGFIVMLIAEARCARARPPTLEGAVLEDGSAAAEPGLEEAVPAVAARRQDIGSAGSHLGPLRAWDMPSAVRTALWKLRIYVVKNWVQEMSARFDASGSTSSNCCLLVFMYVYA